MATQEGDKAVDTHTEGLGRPGTRCGGGNYMFLQVAPSPTTDAVVPFAEYYSRCKARARARAAAGAGVVQMHPAASAAVLYKV